MAGPADDGLNTDGLGADPVERMIRVDVPAALADVVSDRFWQLGVRAVSERDLPSGRVEVTSSVGNDRDAIDRAVASFDAGWEWRIEEVVSTAADDWKRFAAPVWYRPGMVMVPAWLADDADTSGADISSAELVTLVEPGSAFGLGDHPTTKGSMALLADILRDHRRSVSSVIDVGCGTGVLAVLAAQLDVGRVRAIDVAEAAVAATRHNAASNGVADRIEVDTTPLARIDATFDVVVANILAPVLVALGADLVRVVAPGGSLVISGILERRHRHVLDALAPLEPVASIADAGWITIELRHPSPASGRNPSR